MNKKFKIVPATFVMSCLTHANTLWCLSILVVGGHMEWNTNSDKTILNWLANCTPPSCIRVNLLLMALAINPNFEVVKEIPCVRHIQVLCTVLSNVTQSVAGKIIAESTKINQLHTDGTSHKGTEIVNIFCSILNHRWELPGNYPVFTVVMVIYHDVERIWKILVTPNFLYNIYNHL